MALIVQKFGGTSIANVDRIKSVANLVRDEVDLGNQVIVVVSAMAGVTNQLVGWSHQCVNHSLDAAEYDVVVSSGEQVTCGLMALVLNDIGLKARSWLAWQIGVHTTDTYKNARITEIDHQHIRQVIENGEVAVVSGFQGICANKRLTTLGRGGSDYTAVALAAEFGADRCDIYTDVDGIYTADPRAVTNARLIPSLSYQDALDFALHGAKVLQAQAIERASEANIPVRVLSSFHRHDGTVLSQKAKHKTKYIGVASRRDRSLLSLQLTAKGTQKVDRLKNDIQAGYIDLDPVTTFEIKNNELNLLVSKDDFESVETIIHQFKQKHKDTIEGISVHSRIAKVALVGEFDDSQPQLVKKVKETLEEQDITIYHTIAENNALSFLVAPDQMEEVVKILHKGYILSQANIKEVA